RRSCSRPALDPAPKSDARECVRATRAARHARARPPVCADAVLRASSRSRLRPGALTRPCLWLVPPAGPVVTVADNYVRCALAKTYLLLKTRLYGCRSAVHLNNPRRWTRASAGAETAAGSGGWVSAFAS